ncbi:tail protein (tape measure), partial [Enterobacter cloacae]|uniref:phage tail tape measure protein n=1 Tax=Enterobacter cloacae TaxID=550 RepID=UPI00335D04B1|nr:tail protein (tape measure) [Enterobacter cloacae]
LQSTESSTKSGADAIRTFLGPLTELVRVAGEAQINLSGMKKEVDNLTSGQKNLIKQSERNLALSKLQGEARARLQAQYAAEDAGFAKDDPHAKQMEDDAAATYKNTEAQKALKSEQKKGASQAESIAQKLANLKQQSELAADSTNKLSREQAILNAQQSLGKGATKEQIALAGQYAAKKWDTANAIKAQAAAEKLLPEARENASYRQDVEDLNTALAAKKISQEQFNQTSERLEATHQANLAKIRADQAVTPQQDAVGGIDPVQQLANENARKLALIQAYEQQGLITHQNALMLRANADKEYEQARISAQWQIWRNQSLGNEMLAASFESLAGNASNAFTGILTGSMSAQEAMQSLASNALNSLINGFVQMGVEWVKSAITGSAAQIAATTATTSAAVAGTATTTVASVSSAAATTAAWTPAAIVASIGSFGGAAAIGIGAVIAAMAMSSSLAGKRKNGGPVSAGSMYQVGEGGMPEIYRASNGSQYMIPGDNGKVISNKELSSGSGAVPIYLNIQNYTGATVDAQATQDGNGVTIDMIVADLNNGGRVSQAIQQNHQAPRKARG